MIKGDLYFRSTPPNTTNPISLPIGTPDLDLPIWCAQPWIDVEIEIPSLSVKRIFTMLVDSGADGTILNVRDALATIDQAGFHMLQQAANFKSSIGFGGSALNFRADAKIMFQHDDGSLEGYDFELGIAKPARKGTNKLDLQLRLPSVLGRDILCQFCVTMDYSKCSLILDH